LHDITFKAIDEGFAVGSISEEGYAKAIENRYNYAPFAVVDHISAH